MQNSTAFSSPGHRACLPLQGGLEVQADPEYRRDDQGKKKNELMQSNTKNHSEIASRARLSEGDELSG